MVLKAIADGMLRVFKVALPLGLFLVIGPTLAEAAPPQGVPVPELDAATASSALALVIGCAAILRDRRRR